MSRSTPAYFRERIERRVKAGVCVSCSMPARENRRECAACAVRHASGRRVSIERRRRERSVMGLCSQCGGEREREDRAWCSKCREAAVIWRLRRLARGVCRCGGELRDRRWRMCGACRLRARVRWRDNNYSRSLASLHVSFDEKFERFICRKERGYVR